MDTVWRQQAAGARAGASSRAPQAGREGRGVRRLAAAVGEGPCSPPSAGKPSGCRARIAEGHWRESPCYRLGCVICRLRGGWRGCRGWA